ncbi:MAG: thioredoxin domain-containing protein [Pseudomonadota bacterium]
MKTLLTLAFAFMAFVPQAIAMDGSHDKMMEKKPSVKAVVFFSENCGSCKILDPKMKAAMKAVNTDAIEVVKLDFTSKETIEATKVLATDKELGGLLQKFGAKTGFVTLVDANGQILDKIGKNDTEAEIASKIASAIITAS